MMIQAVHLCRPTCAKYDISCPALGGQYHNEYGVNITLYLPPRKSIIVVLYGTNI